MQASINVCVKCLFIFSFTHCLNFNKMKVVHVYIYVYIFPYIMVMRSVIGPITTRTRKIEHVLPVCGRSPLLRAHTHQKNQIPIFGAANRNDSRVVHWDDFGANVDSRIERSMSVLGKIVISQIRLFGGVSQRGPMDSTPPQYVCPLTRKTFADPVLTSELSTYEYHAIVRHMARGNLTDPVTGRVLENLYLIPNFQLKREIRLWRQAVKERQYAVKERHHAAALQRTRKLPEYNSHRAPEKKRRLKNAGGGISDDTQFMTPHWEARKSVGKHSREDWKPASSRDHLLRGDVRYRPHASKGLTGRTSLRTRHLSDGSYEIWMAGRARVYKIKNPGVDYRTAGISQLHSRRPLPSMAHGKKGGQERRIGSYQDGRHSMSFSGHHQRSIHYPQEKYQKHHQRPIYYPQEKHQISWRDDTPKTIALNKLTHHSVARSRIHLPPDDCSNFKFEYPSASLPPRKSSPKTPTKMRDFGHYLDNLDAAHVVMARMGVSR
ncbi:hypothetical protein AAMO2058_001640800 [Amorphochlora amoebiformis]